RRQRPCRPPTRRSRIAPPSEEMGTGPLNAGVPSPFLPNALTSFLVLPLTHQPRFLGEHLRPPGGADPQRLARQSRLAVEDRPADLDVALVERAVGHREAHHQLAAALLQLAAELHPVLLLVERPRRPVAVLRQQLADLPAVVSVRLRHADL